MVLHRVTGVYLWVPPVPASFFEGVRVTEGPGALIVLGATPIGSLAGGSSWVSLSQDGA